jgi:hypothetical protein
MIIDRNRQDTTEIQQVDPSDLTVFQNLRLSGVFFVVIQNSVLPPPPLHHLPAAHKSSSRAYQN